MASSVQRGTPAGLLDVVFEQGLQDGVGGGHSDAASRTGIFRNDDDGNREIRTQGKADEPGVRRFAVQFRRACFAAHL